MSLGDRANVTHCYPKSWVVSNMERILSLEEIQNANVTEHNSHSWNLLEPPALSLSGRSKAFAMFHNDSCGLRHSVPDCILLEYVLPTTLGRWHEGTVLIVERQHCVWWRCSGIVDLPAYPSIYLDFWYGSSTTPKWHQISRWFLIISPMPLRPGIATLRNVPGGFHRSKAGGTSSAFKYHPMGHGQPRAPGRMPILWRNGEIRGILNHRWIGINGYQRNKQKHVQRNVRLGAAAEAMHPFYYLASCLQFAFAKCIELHIIQTSSGKGIYLTVPTQICRYIAGSTFHRFGQLTKFHLWLLTSM